MGLKDVLYRMHRLKVGCFSIAMCLDGHGQVLGEGK